MATYIVDRDLPGITRDPMRAAQRAAIDSAERFTLAGKPVRYLLSTSIHNQTRRVCLPRLPWNQGRIARLLPWAGLLLVSSGMAWVIEGALVAALSERESRSMEPVLIALAARTATTASDHPRAATLSFAVPPDRHADNLYAVMNAGVSTGQPLTTSSRP